MTVPSRPVCYPYSPSSFVSLLLRLCPGLSFTINFNAAAQAVAARVLVSLGHNFHSTAHPQKEVAAETVAADKTARTWSVVGALALTDLDDARRRRQASGTCIEYTAPQPQFNSRHSLLSCSSSPSSNIVSLLLLSPRRCCYEDTIAVQSM